MLDLIPLSISVPASGVRTVVVPFANPLESLEVQATCQYVGTGGTSGSDTLTITGTGGVGQNITGQIGGIPFTYVGTGGDTTTTIVATNVTAYLKTIPGIVGLVTPVASTNTVVCTANFPGTGSSTITASAVGTGTLVASFGTANLTAGTAATVSATTGLSVAFNVSYTNGVSFTSTNIQPLTVPGLGNGALSTASRVIHVNDPYRVDPGTCTHLAIAVTNLDATYPAIVTVLTEKQI